MTYPSIEEVREKFYSSQITTTTVQPEEEAEEDEIIPPTLAQEIKGILATTNQAYKYLKLGENVKALFLLRQVIYGGYSTDLSDYEDI